MPPTAASQALPCISMGEVVAVAETLRTVIGVAGDSVAFPAVQFVNRHQGPGISMRSGRHPDRQTMGARQLRTRRRLV